MNLTLRHLLTCFCLLFFSNLSIATIESARLNIIKERGTLIVGVKADYPPWGYYDNEGNIIGLEPDLAKDIANRLQVKLQLKAVSASNRINQLESGAVDVLIATMSDTEKRRRQTGIIEPSYYSSGATIILHKKNTHITHWTQLYGSSVCLTKNAYFNRELIERFLLKPKEFEGTLDNLAALKFGKCIAWIYDDTALVNILKEERWKDFTAPLNTIMVQPWAIAVQQSEQKTAFGQFISDAIIDWHRSGKLLALEKKWGIPNSQFLTEQNRRWNEKNKHDYICQRNPDHTFPANCLSRNSIFTTTAIKDNILSQWGIDFPPLYDDYSKAHLLTGIAFTLLLSVLAIIGSLFFGVLVGLTLYVLPNSGAWLVKQCNNVFRMTPPLLNLYIIFFGLGGIASLHYGIQFDAVTVAVVVFSLYAGSSNAALLYEALQAAAAHHHTNSIRALFPPAFQHAYEGINANSVNIVKAVGLASMIAVPELISSSNRIITEYGNKSEMMTFLLLFYFVLIYIFIFLLSLLEKRISHKNGGQP